MSRTGRHLDFEPHEERQPRISLGIDNSQILSVEVILAAAAKLSARVVTSRLRRLSSDRR